MIIRWQTSASGWDVLRFEILKSLCQSRTSLPFVSGRSIFGASFQNNSTLKKLIYAERFFVHLFHIVWSRGFSNQCVCVNYRNSLLSPPMLKQYSTNQNILTISSPIKISQEFQTLEVSQNHSIKFSSQCFRSEILTILGSMRITSKSFKRVNAGSSSSTNTWTPSRNYSNHANHLNRALLLFLHNKYKSNNRISRKKTALSTTQKPNRNKHPNYSTTELFLNPVPHPRSHTSKHRHYFEVQTP